MNDKVYYNTDTQEYIEENELRNEYEDFVDDEENDYISFEEYIEDRLEINGGYLQEVIWELNISA